MPLFDGNTKIDRMVITNSAGTPIEVDVARIGTTPIFPDTVGAPVIDGFTIDSTAVIPNTETTRILTVTGSDDATFNLSVNIGTLDSSDFVITGGSNSYVWTIPAQNNGAPIRSLTATISPTGISILEEGLVNTITLSQSAGTPLLTRNLQRITPDYTYTWDGGDTGIISVGINVLVDQGPGFQVGLVAIGGVNYIIQQDGATFISGGGPASWPSISSGGRYTVLNNISSGNAELTFTFRVGANDTYTSATNSFVD